MADAEFWLRSRVWPASATHCANCNNQTSTYGQLVWHIAQGVSLVPIANIDISRVWASAYAILCHDYVYFLV